SGFNLPSPAPAGPYPASMAALNVVNPNGTWSLFVNDHTSGDSGNIANGWSLSLSLISPVNQAADLSLTGVASPNPCVAGDTLTYTFTVTNAGPNTASFVLFTNPLPATVSLLSANASQGTVVTTPTSVAANLGPINSGATATITVQVSPAALSAGSLTNTATVSAGETDLTPANNSFSVVSSVILPQANVGLSVTSAPNPVVVGSNLTFTFSITNRGPGQALDVALTNPLPAGVAYSSGSSTFGTVSNFGGTVVAQLGSLAPA